MAGPKRGPIIAWHGHCIPFHQESTKENIMVSKAIIIVSVVSVLARLLVA